ncbi:hypothetical protein ABE571_13670 [Stenotrophomonas sp. TWI273]|uniref:hypothetical protein n=1 Tax=Stenotrophomonas sp. TWI273 TaxID=3136774 RepID=UPI003207EC72
MKIISGGAWLMMLVACSPAPSDVRDLAKQTPTEAVPLVAGIDASSGSLAGLRIGMTKDQLFAAGNPIIKRSVMQEGDDYIVMDVSLPDGLVVECWFDQGRIEKLRTISEGLLDEKGVGVGSTLVALKAAYPDGRLVTGNEDGRRYANFVNRSRVVFEMDMAGLPQACFHDESKECEVHPNLRVHGVVLYSGPST